MWHIPLVLLGGVITTMLLSPLWMGSYRNGALEAPRLGTGTVLPAPPSKWPRIVLVRTDCALCLANLACMLPTAKVADVVGDSVSVLPFSWRVMP
jgi:hypothetical protein